MDYPLNIGETNGRFVAYSYNCGLGGVDRPFYVETMQDSTIVYAAGNLLSARFIDDNLITGFGSGGFKITDLITGKKIANTRDFEEFAPAKYRYIGWIEKAEKNQFIVFREDTEQASKDDPWHFRFARDVFVVTIVKETN